MAKNYKIKEIYLTLQGEGHHTGTTAVFCRFSGCNLWSGREEDRSTAICQFCDTDFWGMDGENGGSYSAEELAAKVFEIWNNPNEKPFVVFTGGEPALQMDQTLIDVFHKNKIEVAIETNGTLELPSGIDWICVSPKADTKILLTKGDELKLVFPQLENQPEVFEHLDFKHFYLQPLDSPKRIEHTQDTIDYCKAHPKWKLSVQSHKYLNIP